MTRRLCLCLCLCLCLGALAVPAAARADFGPVPGSTAVIAERRDGTTEARAGSHPYAFTVHFELKTSGGRSEGGEMRDVIADLPPGMVGNPLAVPRCARQSFEGNKPRCPVSTQIGVVHAIVPGVGEAFGPLYNLDPPPGVAAQFGFSSVGLTVLQGATVGPEADPSDPFAQPYGAHVLAPNLPLETTAVTETIWGTPGDPAHDPERGPEGEEGMSSDAPEQAFFTLPTACTTPQITIQADSNLAPGRYVGETVPLEGTDGQPVSLSGCESVPFSPSASSGPSTAAAESPAGLAFDLGLPDHGLLAPAAIAETEPVKTEVALPAGITANPAAATGLGSCSEAQYRAASLAQPGCPADSKLGTITARSPLLEEPIEGAVYLATPEANPFASLIALYIVAAAPQRGVLVKQAGRVDVDPATGQLTTTIEDLPPLPYSGFEVRLREGPRAPLTTPQACGRYTTTAKLYPHSAPGAAVVREVPFTISSGAGGAPCASGEAALPNSPAVSAGTVSPLAGAYSPFLFGLSRPDGSQRLASVTVSPPEGLTGKIAGIPYCPQAALDAAAARSGVGEGALELAAPSCPAASEVGSVTVAVGAGPSPYRTQGKAYLAGPYKGAPLSLAFIAPAIAGPFDLGVVVSRAALQVDPETARLTVQSDPLPQILHGIPLDIRSVTVSAEREGFTLNPTDCEPMQITGSETSLAGSLAPLAERFQVGGCRGLGFKPKMSLRFRGATGRTKHPAFRGVITPGKGQANIARLSFTLPPTVFIDQFHISNPCTRPQFAQGSCPKRSVLGRAKVWSPLLEAPLQGPLYFRANGGARKLPDVVADLHGQIHVVSVGFVDAVHRKGSEKSRIRTTLATIPDAPLSKAVFELKGGRKYGLLVNSQNLCTTKVPQRAVVRMRGHNGKTRALKEKIATGCKKPRKKRHAHHRGG